MLTGKPPAPTGVPVTLAECTARALRGNAEIQSQKIEWDVSTWSVRREWAQFEPNLVASQRNEERTRQNTVEEERNQLTDIFEERNEFRDVGIEGLFFSGARYRLGYSESDLRNNLTNGTFRTEFESQYRTFLGAEVTQPLLRGAWLSANMAAVRLARLQRDKTFQGLRRQMMDVVAQVEAAYWDLLYAQEEYRLRTESVANARKVLDDNRARLAAGKMSEIEVLQAEAGLAERNTRRNETRRQVVQLVRRLNTLMGEASDGVPREWTPADPPRLLDSTLDFDSALYAATQLQPDYLTQEHVRREAELRHSFAKWQRLPQVDVIGKYGYSGLASDRSSSLEEADSQDYPDWTLGIQLSFGLGGDQRSRSELRAAQLRTLQAGIATTNAIVQIANAIHASLQEIDMEREGLADYGKVAEFGARLFEEELRKLDAGKSSSRQVLDVEQEMLEAKVAETRSRNRYQRAVLQLELASGTLLAVRNLEPLPATFTAAAPEPVSADAPPPADVRRPPISAPEPAVARPITDVDRPVPR
jgi:outer membrane protein